MAGPIGLGRLCLDGNSLEVRAFQHGADGTGLFAVLDIELSKLLAIKRAVRRAVKLSLRGVLRRAAIFQYSSRTKRLISLRGRRPDAALTDCTRPAERAPGSLRQSTGERVKPTR